MFLFKKKKAKAENQKSAEKGNTDVKDKTKQQSQVSKIEKAIEKSNEKPDEKPNDNLDPEIIEYIFQFLISPNWANPMFSFIDEYCLVMEKEADNEALILDLHANFRRLRDMILDEMKSDVEISENQFNLAVELGSKNPDYKQAFDQLKIVEDYSLFKKFLKKRSKELEIELEEMGGVRNSFLGKGKPEEEKEELDAIMRESIALADSLKLKMDKEHEEDERLLREAIEKSQQTYEDELKKQEDQKQIEEAMLLAKKLEKKRRNVEEVKPGAEVKSGKDIQIGKLIKQNEPTVEKEKTSFKIKSKTIKSHEKAHQDQNEKQDEPKQTEGELLSKSLIGHEPNRDKAAELLNENEHSKKINKLAESMAPLKIPTSDILLKNRENMVKTLENKSTSQLISREEEVSGEREPEQESYLQRKNRLQAQKELLLKKKRAERETQMKEYNKIQMELMARGENKAFLDDDFRPRTPLISLEVGESKESSKKVKDKVMEIFDKKNKINK